MIDFMYLFKKCAAICLYSYKNCQKNTKSLNFKNVAL